MKTLLLLLLLSLGLNAESLSEKTAHGKEIYTRCLACHGAYGERSALGKSTIINIMSKEMIMTALLGYKNGTYGGEMKKLMGRQLSNYSYADLEALAEYIPSLKELSSTQQQQYPAKTINTMEKTSIPIAPPPKSELILQAWPVQGGIEMKSMRDTNNIVNVKFMIKHPMLTKDAAKIQGVKQEFITRIVAKEGDKTVFDLISSEYLSRNPMLEFKYKSIGASVLSIEATDNNGNKDSLTQPIKEAAKTIPLNETKIIEQKGKPYRVNAPAVKEIFGDIELIDTDEIHLTAPDVAANREAVPVYVDSNIKAKAVTLFDQQEGAQMKFICQWRINENSILDYHVKIKMRNSGNIKIFIEGKDGKFYSVERDVRIRSSSPTCDGS